MKEKVKKSKEYLDKLRMFLERRHCLTFSTVEESLSVVVRETTPFNTIPLEEVATELDCTQAIRSIAEKKRSFSDEAICCNSSRGLSQLATVETLSIAMDYPPGTPNAMIQNFLLSIFGNLFGDVVRWHSISDKHIVCYFPPVYSTLLINKILEKIPLYKKKQVKMITIGYCKLYDENSYGEV